MTRSRSARPAGPPQRTADGPRDVGHLAAWVASQPEGNRNHGLFWASCRAVEAGDAATVDSLAGAARAAGLDEREIGRTIASAQRIASPEASPRPFEHQAPQASGPVAPQSEVEAGR